MDMFYLIINKKINFLSQKVGPGGGGLAYIYIYIKFMGILYISSFTVQYCIYFLNIDSSNIKKQNL